ncbi:MAG: hypothetical protein SVU32_07070 [Candidatus Nanohaloarchaea archaeon]|nr:hypothetical protein [Candidatus Nanohaloarchaea archaeon]
MADQWICPDCGSTDVELNTADPLSIIGIDSKHVCRSCGYTARQFPVRTEEDPEDASEASSINIDDMDPPPARGGGKKIRIVTGTVFILLGFGSLSFATESLTGLWGALLIPVGARMLYEEVKD